MSDKIPRDFEVAFLFLNMVQFNFLARSVNVANVFSGTDAKVSRCAIASGAR